MLYFVMKYDWETITVLDVVNELKIVPIKIVEALLATVGNVHVYWEPDLLKVYQLCAIELFLNNPEYFLDQFEQSYYRLTEFLIPRRMIFDFPLYKVLQGLAISRVSNSKPTVRYFPVTKLSFNFQDRLNFLFSIKEK